MMMTLHLFQRINKGMSICFKQDMRIYVLLCTYLFVHQISPVMSDTININDQYTVIFKWFLKLFEHFFTGKSWKEGDNTEFVTFSVILIMFSNSVLQLITWIPFFVYCSLYKNWTKYSTMITILLTYYIILIEKEVKAFVWDHYLL